MFVIKKPWCSAQAILVGFLLALAAYVLLVADARAAELNFTAPQTLSTLEAGNPQIAVDPQGRATVVWQALGPEATALIQAVRLDPSGLPGPVQTLAEFPKHVSEYPTPKVVVDSSGNATVAWQSYDGASHRIEAVQIDSSGVVHPVHVLSGPGYNALGQQLAIGPEGRVTVVWYVPSQGDVESARLEADGTPEETQTLVEADEAGFPDVAVDSEGKATVVWPGAEGMRAVQIDASGSPGPIRTVPSTGKADGIPQVVVDGKGRATIAWWRGSGAYDVRSVRLDPEGVPGTPQTLTPPEQNAYEPRLAVDSKGNVTVVWQDFQDHVHSVRLDESGAPGPVYTLSEEALVAGEPQVAIGPDDRAVVVWDHQGPPYAPEEGCLEIQFDPPSDAVRAAFLGPEGQPGPVRVVSPFGEQSTSAQVAFGALGLPIVVWKTFDGTYFCSDNDTRVQTSRGVLAIEPEPEPDPESSPSPPPAPEGSGVLRLNGKATVKGRRLYIHVSCAGGACAGRVKLVRSGVAIALGRFRLAAGQHCTLALTLTGFGKKLVAKGSGRLLRTIGRGSGVNKHVVWVRLRGHPH